MFLISYEWPTCIEAAISVLRKKKLDTFAVADCLYLGLVLGSASENDWAPSSPFSHSEAKLFV